jgi:hypothetical protein
MLIDQMKEHPEEFRGYAGKFTSMLDTAREAVQGPHRNVKMSQRDATAIMAAAETHLYEVWLAEDVLTKMMAPKEEPGQYREAMRLGASGSLGIGTAAPSKLYVQNTANNTSVSSPTFEESFQREMERYKMEDFKRRELEYAMRNTKPFKDFP